MNTHDILLTVQYITVSVLFVEVWIVLLKWKNSIHSYLFLACISTFISNIGYLLEMKATSEESYITALKLSYVGRVWIVLALFLFSAKMCRIRIHKGIVAFLVLLHMGIYISILTLEKNKLYYKDYQFINDPVFPRFVRTNGTLHDLLMALNGVLIVWAMTWVILEFKREKNKNSKLRLSMLIMAFGIQAFSFVLHVTGIIPVSQYYDLTMLGALFGTVFMLIGILGFDLLGTREIARDFVVDRISEGIIAVDNDGRIQYYNEPAAKLYPEFDAFFPVSKERLEEKGVEKSDEAKSARRGSKHVYTPYDIIAIIKDAVNAGETLKIDDRIYTPEENELVYKGESYGKLYALVDDTDHYRYMQELEKQKDIADSANKAKSTFLANMSHEIRTPINAVLGMNEMILRESSEKETLAYARDIRTAGRTLLSLINDILDFSKVEEGKMEIIPTQYELSSLIGDLSNMIRDRAAKKGLKFNVKVNIHVPHLLYGDEIRIKQIVLNLLTNAVKYTEKGEVELNVDFEKENEDNIFLSFKVSDTGIGMKQEDMEKLFSPFTRIEEQRNRSIEGTGLGMSIVKQLLALMDSKLEVTSVYGEGSQFSFAIRQKVEKWEPIGDIAVRYDSGKDGSYEYHELFRAPDANILVVDDTEMNLTVIQNLLKKTLVKIDTAASGREAVAQASGKLYDVIFIDHMMPDMDGIETLRHIRESGMSKDTPAVALTANAVSGAREMYLEAGFTDYLSKPVDGTKLERMLYDMLPDEKLNEPGDADEKAVASKENELPVWLCDIKEIDVEKGLANCGEADGYLSVLKVFHRTGAVKADEIEKLYKDNDIKNYTIKVHALKSSARIIGASELSELAKSLEDAGNAGDTAYIDANTEKLLGMYRALDAKLSGFDETKESLPELSASSLKEAYQTMVEIAGSMDYGMMDTLLNDIKGYSLPDADREKIKKIEGMLAELDWDSIAKTAGENM